MAPPTPSFRPSSLIGLALAVVTAGLVAACGGPAARPSGGSSGSVSSTGVAAVSTTSASSCKSVKAGGNFTWGVNADVIDMDPDSTQDPMSIQAELGTFDQLVHLNPAGTKEVPDLASSWSTSGDGRVWTFHLRPGIKFSNGDPITAAAVKYSYDRNRSPQSVVNWTLAAIKSDKVINKSTFQVTLKAPTASFLSDTQLWGASIVDPKAVPKQGKSFASISHFVGSGPFYVSAWSQGSQIVLKRNPYYWQKDACGNKLPYLSTITMKYMPDDSSRVTALQGGAVDAINAVPYNQLSTLSNSGSLQAQAAPEAGKIAVPINLKAVPAMKDPKVVQAVNYAIDRKAIVKVAFSGYGEPGTSPISYGSNFFTAKYGYPYDLAKAKRLMASSSDPKGFAATFLIPSGNTVAQSIAQVMQTDLAKIDVKLKIQQIDSTTLSDQEAENKFDMAYQQGTSQNLDPSSNSLYCCVTNGGANSGHTGWDMPAANALFEKTEKELNVAARGALYDKWQEMVVRNSPVLFIAYPRNAYANADSVHGFTPQITVNWDLAQIWKG